MTNTLYVSGTERIGKKKRIAKYREGRKDSLQRDTKEKMMERMVRVLQC